MTLRYGRMTRTAIVLAAVLALTMTPAARQARFSAGTLGVRVDVLVSKGNKYDPSDMPLNRSADLVSRSAPALQQIQAFRIY